MLRSVTFINLWNISLPVLVILDSAFSDHFRNYLMMISQLIFATHSIQAQHTAVQDGQSEGTLPRFDEISVSRWGPRLQYHLVNYLSRNSGGNMQILGVLVLSPGK